MEFIPIKTRILLPPQDDFLAVLRESVPSLAEGDIVIVSSKVVAIHEGRCVSCLDTDKTLLINNEADFIIHTEYRTQPLTVTRHAFLGAAGIDESNGNGHYILLLEDCFASAAYLHQFLCETYSIKNLGVVITDSRSQPFRYGAIGVALGWWGITPLEDHVVKEDLFGRTFKYKRSNIVDGLAAGATVVAGETDECIPIVITRNVPQLTFNEIDTRSQLLAPYDDDTFRILYERWL